MYLGDHEAEAAAASCDEGDIAANAKQAGNIEGHIESVDMMLDD